MKNQIAIYEERNDRELNSQQKLNLKDRLCVKKECLKQKIFDFIKKEDGMGVVEVILITIVLIALVLIFKKQISALVNTILEKMSGNANKV